MITTVQVLLRRKLKGHRWDGGGEYIGRKLKTWFSKTGVTHEFASPYYPESNRKSARLNRTMLDIALTWMVDAENIHGCYALWAEAVIFANDIRNRSFTTPGIVGNLTSYDAVYMKKPDISFIGAF